MIIKMMDALYIRVIHHFLFVKQGGHNLLNEFFTYPMGEK